jgi:transposase
MDHVTNEPPRRAGGDKHTPQAKVDIARREQQIVALRLRGISFHEIGRVIGISRISAYRAFHKALRRNTDQDIQTHHRSELAELEAEQANVWRAMDANKDDWRAQMSGTAQLRGIHVRRAKLLGLDELSQLCLKLG